MVYFLRAAPSGSLFRSGSLPPLPQTPFLFKKSKVGLMGILSYAGSVLQTSPLDSFGEYSPRAAPSGSLFRSGSLPPPFLFKKSKVLLILLQAQSSVRAKPFAYNHAPGALPLLFFAGALLRCSTSLRTHPYPCTRVRLVQLSNTPSTLNPVRKIKSFYFPQYSAFLEKKRGGRGERKNFFSREKKFVFSPCNTPHQPPFS